MVNYLITKVTGGYQVVDPDDPGHSYRGHQTEGALIRKRSGGASWTRRGRGSSAAATQQADDPNNPPGAGRAPAPGCAASAANT